MYTGFSVIVKPFNHLLKAKIDNAVPVCCNHVWSRGEGGMNSCYNTE